MLVGSGNDLQLLHNGTNSFIINETGNLTIRNRADDSDIIFECDDGSGATTEYFKLDGSLSDGTYKYTKWTDYSVVSLGTGNDFQLFHDSTKSRIENLTGNLEITQKAADADIIFQADGGSGSAVEYMRLDGSQTSIRMKRQVKWDDNIKATFGNSDDLQLYHDGSNSYIYDGGVGDLNIVATDLNLKAASDELYLTATSNGAVELYYNNNKKFETTSSGVNVVSGTVAGSTHRLSVGKVSSNIGNQKSILELVENTSGSDMNYGFSFTTDGDGSNNLLLRRHQNSTTGAIVMTVNRADDNVTFAGNLKIQGVSEYADNTAAIAAGLTTGQLYRTGDLLKIVH